MTRHTKKSKAIVEQAIDLIISDYDRYIPTGNVIFASIKEAAKYVCQSDSQAKSKDHCIRALMIIGERNVGVEYDGEYALDVEGLEHITYDKRMTLDALYEAI